MERSHVLFCVLLVPLAACPADGEPGLEGTPGPRGLPGEVGPAGPQGPAGAQGLTGPQGPAGPAGPMGPAGAAGAIGPQGVAGPQGLRGLTGMQGALGPQGIPGQPGMQGPVGPAGPAGPEGVPGPEGPPGADAMRGYASRTWEAGTNIPCCGWNTIAPSTIVMTTGGGPLMISMSISLSGGSHGTCRPIVDGVWAATFEGEVDPNTPHWPEGLTAVGCCGGGWRRWDKTRIYAGIPAGQHTFAIQCATDGGTMSASTGSVRSSWSVLELAAPPPLPQ